MAARRPSLRTDSIEEGVDNDQKTKNKYNHYTEDFRREAVRRSESPSELENWNTPDMQHLELSGGRRLGFTEYGNPAGKPVIYCHGSPGSRLEPAGGSLPANVRVIAPDRPGFGGSDPDSERTFLNWPDDVAELADHLSLEHFAVLGFSGGGPYALACGHKLADRTAKIGIVSSPAPFASTDGPPPATAAYYEAAQASPEALLASLTEQAPDGDALWTILTGDITAADSAVFELANIGPLYRRNLGEAIRQGVDEIVRELRLIGDDWRFLPEQVDCEVQLWHGSDDANVPVSMGSYLRSKLPHCGAEFLPGQGHFFLLRDWHRILSKLTRP